jgi:hypothetical protein
LVGQAHDRRFKLATAGAGTRVTAMFTVRWVVRGNDAEPVEVEKIKVLSVETVLAACRYRLVAIRLKHPDNPPDGFIVLNESGRELRRWFGDALL